MGRSTVKDSIIRVKDIINRLEQISRMPDSKNKKLSLKFTQQSLKHNITSLKELIYGEYISVELDVEGNPETATFVNLSDQDIHLLYGFKSDITGKVYKIKKITRIPTKFA